MKRIKVEFSGGHETDPVDRGRPVKLIAAALGVSPEVFRDAFSRVRPAPAGQEPDPQQVRQNKAALMAALGPLGVTNERLDAVSNYYRYPPGRGKLWRTQPAVAETLVKDGVITGFEVIAGGSGYTSPPIVTVPGFKQVPVQVQLSFGVDLDRNGSVTAINLVPPVTR